MIDFIFYITSSIEKRIERTMDEIDLISSGIQNPD